MTKFSQLSPRVKPSHHMREAKRRLCLLSDTDALQHLLSLKSYRASSCPPLDTLHAPKVSGILVLSNTNLLIWDQHRGHSINMCWMNEIRGPIFCCFSLDLKPSVPFNDGHRLDAQRILMTNLSHHKQSNYLVFSCPCLLLSLHRNVPSQFSQPWSMFFLWSCLLISMKPPSFVSSTRFWNLGQGCSFQNASVSYLWDGNSLTWTVLWFHVFPKAIYLGWGHMPPLFLWEGQSHIFKWSQPLKQQETTVSKEMIPK